MRKLRSTLPILLVACGFLFAAAVVNCHAQSEAQSEPQVPASAAPHVSVSTSPLTQVIQQAPIVARRGGWHDVEDLPSGTHISVQTLHGRRFGCVFESATDSELVCEPLRRTTACFACVLLPPIIYGPIYTDFRYVRDVHIEHPGSNMAIGLAAGVGAGLLWGSRDTDATRPASMLVGGALLGTVGGFIGRHTPIIRGTVIYER